MKNPRLLIERDGRVDHSSVWLKAVHAVDLEVHCINSLIGPRIPVDRAADFQRIDIEDVAPAYYLCAVSAPYRWDQNAHAFMFRAPGEEHTVTQPGLSVTMFGLRPMEIRPGWITDPARYGWDRLFTTCRNLQAATWLHQVGGLENRPNPERGRYARPRQRPQSSRLF